MPKEYSIAQAGHGLSAIVREGARFGRANITRRGRPVAVVLSIAEFERLSSTRREPDWSLATLDTRGFKFDRDEANRR